MIKKFEDKMQKSIESLEREYRTKNYHNSALGDIPFKGN